MNDTWQILPNCPSLLLLSCSMLLWSLPGHKIDAERPDGGPDPRDRLAVDLPGLLQLEVLHQVDQQQEVVSPGEDLPGAPALPHAEEDDLLVGDESAGGWVDEAFGAEGGGVGEVLGVVVPDVGAVKDLRRWGKNKLCLKDRL